MKVVFLDIDGVLNNPASAAEHIDIIPEKVIMIRRLCEATGATIVVSSSWRAFFSLAELQQIFRITGLGPIRIIGVTPRLGGVSRGYEIQNWLVEHKVTKYVILDDDSDMLPEQKECFIQVENILGLTYRDVDKAIEILGEER